MAARRTFLVDAVFFRSTSRWSRNRRTSPGTKSSKSRRATGRWRRSARILVAAGHRRRPLRYAYLQPVRTAPPPKMRTFRTAASTYDVFSTPALVISDSVVVAGRIPTPAEIAVWLKAAPKA